MLFFFQGQYYNNPHGNQNPAHLHTSNQRHVSMPQPQMVSFLYFEHFYLKSIS